MLLDPPLPCHKLSHLLGPHPLERDVLYGRPHRRLHYISCKYSRRVSFLLCNVMSKSPKTSQRPQKPSQGEQLIHRRHSSLTLVTFIVTSE